MQNASRGFDVKASWSKAGIGTSFILEQRSDNKKRFQIVLDLGCTPIFDQTIPVSCVVLSHGHIDHFGGIFSHARAHNMQCGGSIPSYYVPHDLVPKMQKAREIFSDIDATCCNDDFDGPNRRDKGHIEMNIIPIKAGETIELKQSKIRGGVRFYLKPFHVSHCGHPALGFTIISKTTTTGLKAEYKDLSGKELGGLARSGVSIKESTEVEKAEVCYTGDTALDGLMRADRHDTSASLENLYQGFTASLILCELTFLDPKDREKAKERGHLNIKDIEPILNSHGWKPSCASNNDCNIVFYHVSSRHGPVERILEILIRELPSHITEVGEVAVASFIPSGFNFEGVQPNGCISLREYNKLLKG